MDKKFLKKLRESDYEFTLLILERAMCRLTSLGNEWRGQLVDETFDDRAKLYERCAQCYRHLYFDYEHNLDMCKWVVVATSILNDVTILYNINLLEEK